MKPTFHEVTSKSIADLRSCLAEWCQYVLRYCRDVPWKNEVPWQYNERAILSTFAAAVAQKRGLVLEEFGEAKRRRTKEGRVDLWFSVPRCRQKGFVAEAKYGWARMPTRREHKARQRCVGLLNDAVGGVNELVKDYGAKRIGLAFVVPAIRGLGNVDRCVADIQRIARRQVRPDALAWVFPDLATTLRSEDGRYLPGVMLLVGVARNRKR